MATKVISGATQTDADIANAMDSPVAGVHVGPGIHVVIPEDFAARIAAGQDVAGCNYVRPNPQIDNTGKTTDTLLMVTDAVQAKLVVPAEVSKLSAPLQTAIPALSAKLVTATPAATVAVIAVEELP
jgi:hypothetical protein